MLSRSEAALWRVALLVITLLFTFTSVIADLLATECKRNPVAGSLKSSTPMSKTACLEVAALILDLMLACRSGTAQSATSRALCSVTGLFLVTPSLLASDSEPAWSPDGKRIVFMSDRSGDIEIYVTGIDGSRLVQLTRSPGRDAHPAFSHDGTKIAFQSPRDGSQAQIYVMKADGSGQVKLTNLRGFTGVPDWSPDDTKIVFQSNLNPSLDQPRNWQIFVMNADGTGLRQLTHDAFNDQVPKWSPDGKRILFFSDKTGHNQLYTMRSDGGDWQRVMVDDRDDTAATWSADGWRILFTSDAGSGANIYSYDLRRHKLRQLTKNAPGLGTPHWSPDERTITFTVTRVEHSEVWFMDANGSHPRRAAFDTR